MLFAVIIAVIIGIVLGGVVNVLADDLPYRRNPGVPTYADGTPRPMTAWLGLTAFALGQREPDFEMPDDKRKREHRTSNKLSWRHPLTELFTAFLMVITFTAVPQLQGMGGLSDIVFFAQFLFYLTYMFLFAVITVIDIEHKLILFIVIIPAILLGILDAILLPQFGPNLRSSLLGGAMGFGVFFAMYLGGYAFNFVMSRVQGREINTVAFGYGDVMMITFTGVVLGLENIFFALFITVFLGASGAIIYLVARRLLGNKYEAFTALPYGPYIVAGTIIIMLYAHPVQCTIWNWSLQGPC